MERRISELTWEVPIVLQVPFSCHLVEHRVVYHVDHCSWTQYVFHMRRKCKTIAKFAHTYTCSTVFVYGDLHCSERRVLLAGACIFYLRVPLNRHLRNNNRYRGNLTLSCRKQQNPTTKPFVQSINITKTHYSSKCLSEVSVS